MFDNQVIHTEHRDVIHDCSYDYYGQVSALESWDSRSFPVVADLKQFRVIYRRRVDR